MRYAFWYAGSIPVLVLFMIVWAALPVKVVTITHIQAPDVVKVGDTVSLAITYCKYLDVWPDSQPVVLDIEGRIMTFQAIPVPKGRHAKPGCGVNIVPAFRLTFFNPQAVSGHMARARVSWKYRALGRTITTSGWTTPFMISD